MFSSRSQSGPRMRLRSQVLAYRRVLRPLLILAILAIGLVSVPLLLSPVHAVGTPTVFLTPSFRAFVASNAVTHFAVNVTNMPLFNGFNIFIKVNPSLLKPTSISTVGIIFASPLEDINCVNAGAGITLGNPGNLGCTPQDGPGIAHEEVLCNGCFAQGSGLLFNVTFTGQTNTVGNSVVDVYNDQILNGTPTFVAHLTTSGTYGTGAPADYTIAASPISQNIPQGTSGSVVITLTSVNAFAGTVTLNTRSFPAALNTVTSLNTSSVALTAGGTKHVGATISPTPSTPGGGYDLVLNSTATAVIAIIHDTSVSVTVTIPDFSIVPNPNKLFVPLGSTNTSILTLTSVNSFAGVVTLSTTIFPSLVNGPTITLSNSSFTGSSVRVTLTAGGTNTATLTVSSSATTAVNSYSITVTGASGSLSRTASVSVSVVPFTIGANPGSVSMQRGAFGTSTITLGSVSNAASKVTLTTTISNPPGSTPPTATYHNSTFSGTTIIVRVPAGGTSSVTLTVNATRGPSPPATTAGSYTVVVTGTVGTASRVTQVGATVLPPTLVSVVVGTDGNLYFNPFGGAWGPWLPLGGHSPSPPSLCPSGSGNVELVVRGSDDGVYQKTFSATSGAFSGSWVKSPGGLTIDQPACAVIGTTLYVVVRGSTTELWATTLNLSTRTWAATWTDLGGFSPSAPALAATPALSRLDLVVRGANDQIYHKAFTSGAWAAAWDTSNRTPVPDKTLATPAIVSDGSQLHLVVLGTEANIWYATLSFAGVWSTWTSLVGSSPVTPTLTIDSANTLHLVVQGFDSAVYAKSKTSGGSWSATWSSAGGQTSGTPAVAMLGSTVNVVAMGADARVWYNTLTGTTWSGWVSMNGAAHVAPSVSAP